MSTYGYTLPLPLSVAILYGYSPMERGESQPRIELLYFPAFYLPGPARIVLTTIDSCIKGTSFDLICCSPSKRTPIKPKCLPPFEGRFSSLPLNKRMVFLEDLSPSEAVRNKCQFPETRFRATAAPATGNRSTYRVTHLDSCNLPLTWV